MNSRRLFGAFLVGGIGGAICDQIHVQSGTTIWAQPDLFGQPWWTALVFGTGVLIAYVVAQSFAPKVYPQAPSLDLLGRAVIVFLAAYFCSAFLHTERDLCAAILWGTFFARVALHPQRKPLATFGLMVAIGGSAIEISLSALGTFHYVNSDLLGIPLWLPALYAHAAPLGLALTRRFPLS